MSKRKKFRIYSNRGSAMTLVIICIAVVSITISTITFQNVSQIKTTIKNNVSQDNKYAAEAGVERTIAEICKQIENNVNTTTVNSKLIKTNDKFEYIKIQLKKVLEDLNSIQADVSNIESSINVIINRNHSTEEELIRNLIELKDVSIVTAGDIAYDNESIRTSIYLIINKINQILELGYSYEHLDHDAFEFSESSTEAKNQINNYFRDGSSQTSQNYTTSRIANEEVVLAKQNVSDARSKIPTSTHSDVSNHVQRIINEVGYITTNYIKGGTSLVPGLGSVRNELQDLINVVGKSTFEDKKLDVCKVISAVIDKINEVENELYKLYVEKRNPNSGAWQPGPYIDIINNLRPEVTKAIKNLDIAKRNLIETKCKLGDKYIPPAIENPGTGTTKKIQIPENIYSLDNNMKSKVEGIEREIPLVYDSNNILQSIEDININIISTGYEGNTMNDNYKIKTSIVVKSKKNGNLFETSYEILSHDRIK